MQVLLVINYSNTLNYQIRSKEIIEKAHFNINKFIKKGTCLPLQENLRNIMWQHCGVIKNHESLNVGLKKIREIKNQLNNIDVRIGTHNCNDRN